MNKHKFEIILFWSDKDLVFIAEVPELPGCSAYGSSREEALINVESAIELWIETATEFGNIIPEPKGSKFMYT